MDLKLVSNAEEMTPMLCAGMEGSGLGELQPPVPEEKFLRDCCRLQG